MTAHDPSVRFADTSPASLGRERTTALWRRVKPVVLALIVPLLLLAFWQVATTQRWTLLIPTPYAVAEYMVDFAVGGIYDDAYSATLLTHLLASMSRVYGGFALAALFALPIGIMVGRMPTARMLLDPFLQVMRPIPVTAWLPLSMILFGLGAKSAFALVCLGAFYPILLNTIFGVRSVDPKLFEAASMLGCRGNAQFYKVVLPAATPAIFTGLRLGLGLAWFVIQQRRTAKHSRVSELAHQASGLREVPVQFPVPIERLFEQHRIEIASAQLRDIHDLQISHRSISLADSACRTETELHGNGLLLRGVNLSSIRALGLAVILLNIAAIAGTKLDHPAPGTSIVRFTELDSDVYKGSKPKNDADYAFLQSKHVKYILNLRFLPLLSRPER